MDIKSAHMNKRPLLSIASLVFLVALVYLLYRVLLEEEVLPFSISAVQLSINQWIKHWHFLAAGLVPLYVALAFFGVLIFWVFFGSVVQRWVFRLFPKK